MIQTMPKTKKQPTKFLLTYTRKPRWIILGSFFLTLVVLLSSCIPARDSSGRWSEKAASQAIMEYYQAQLPDLSRRIKFPVEEITNDDIWQYLTIQVFRVTGDIYENETFIFNNDTLIQMGTAFGGSGVTDMVLSDLDQDTLAELFFTYSFGSGIHRTRFAVYAPKYDKENIIECEEEYFGETLIEAKTYQDIRLKILEFDSEGNESEYAYTLGSLSLVKDNQVMNLVLEINPSLPERFYEGISVFK